MTLNKMNNEKFLYLTSFAFALIFRLFDLGAIPLTEFEANWALQAFQVTIDQATTLGPQPAYIFLTGFLFNLFGSSDFLARLLPALAGTAILYFPFTLRDKIGRSAALIFAFALAFDPGLVSLSRIAGGPIFAISFFVLAISFAIKKKFELAGAFLGLYLLSGPIAIIGLLIIGLSIVFYVIIQKNEMLISKTELQRVGLSAGITFVLVATNLFRTPSGICAFGSSITAFLQGFTNPSQIGFGRQILALLTYQPLAIIFTIYGFRFAQRSNNALIKSSLPMLVIGFLWMIVYPARQVGDLVWIIIPLWCIASIGLSEFIKRKPILNWTVILATALVILLLFVFVWLLFINLSALSQPPMWGDMLTALSKGQFNQINQFDFATKSYFARIGTLILLPLLTVLLTLLGGLWWNSKDVWTGYGWGVLSFLLIFVAGSTWNANYMRSRQVNELWGPGTSSGYPDLIYQTVESLSIANFGSDQDIDVYSQVDSNSLAWTFRNFPNYQYAKEISYDEFPSVVITPDHSGDPNLNSSYRGQSFMLAQQKSWENQLLPPNFPNWLAFRNTLSTPEMVIVWVTTELFPDSTVPETENPLIDPFPLESQP